MDVLEVKGDVPYWIIANELGIHENTFRNWMRKEMTVDRKEKVIAAIERVKKEMELLGA